MSADLLEKSLHELESRAAQELENCSTLERLEEIRLAQLGKKGALTTILRGLGGLGEASEKQRIGALANQVKERISTRLDAVKVSLQQAALSERLSRERIDVTLPGAALPLGRLHPLTRTQDEICRIFHGMGFTIVEGPEVETDYYNFDALNTPGDHPARDEQDTFYTTVGPEVLLRSQTSTVQIREMEKSSPPLRIISPGRVYRNEEVNARKYPLFHQVEGLLVERDVNFGQLKGTLSAFIRALFGRPLKTRFRPDFFPFTEPSAELDSQCPFCEGEGCRTCGNRGWLELLGCGMVDPNVLEGVGIDPEQWSGFAFGMGVERLAMLRYGVTDIRYFYTNELRFLEQF